MTNKLKMLLKTTAAVATLMVGSQNWAAVLLDDAGATVAAGDAIPAAAYGRLVAMGAVSVDHTGTFTMQANGKYFLVPLHDGTDDMVLTQSGAVTLASNSDLYLLSRHATVPKIIISGVMTPTSVTGVRFLLEGAATLPDLSSFPGVALIVLRSLTLTSATAFGGYIEISEGSTLTPATWAACGGLLGSGTFAAANTNLTVNGDVSGDLTLTLTGMSGAGRALVVTGNFATTKAFTSVPGSGADGLTTVNGNMVLGAAFTTAGGGVTVTTGDLSVAGLTTVAASAPLVVTAGDAAFNALTANAAVTVTAGDATFAGAVSAASAAADITVGRDVMFSGTFGSVSGANLVVARHAAFSSAVTSAGDVAITGNGTFSSAVTSDGTVTVGGNAAFAALTATKAVDVTGNATFSGAVSAANANADITVGGDAAFSGTLASVAGADLTVAGNGTFSGAVTAAGAIDITGNGTFSSAVTSDGAVSVGGNAAFAALTATKAVDVAGSATFSGAVSAAHADAKITLAQGATFSGTFASVAGADLTVQGGDATFAGVVSAAGAVIVDRNVTFADDASVGGLNVVGNAVFEGDLTLSTAAVLNVAGSVNLKGNLTAGASSQIILPGAMVGTGSMNLSSIAAGIPSFGDASGFTGAVVLGSQPVVFAKAPASVFTGHQNNVTFTNGGTVARMMSAGVNAKVTGTSGDVVITEYEVPNAFAATFAPGAGKKMTVTTLTQHSLADEAITVSASTGTMTFKSNIKAGGSAAHTFNAPTSIAKYTLLAGATPVITINENVTITELDISAAGVTFVVADGKTLTVTKVTGNGNVTVNGAGTLAAKLPASYTGNVVTGGTAKLK